MSTSQDIITCDICKQEPLHHFCNGCEISLCKKCVVTHLESESVEGHTIVQYKHRDARNIQPKVCLGHPSMLKILYCKKCSAQICLSCIAEHGDHMPEVVDLKQFVNSQYMEIVKISEHLNIKSLPKCRLSIEKMREILTEANTKYNQERQKIFDVGEVLHRKIKEEVDDLLAEIDKQKKETLEKLQDLIKCTEEKLQEIDETIDKCEATKSSLDEVLKFTFDESSLNIAETIEVTFPQFKTPRAYILDVGLLKSIREERRLIDTPLKEDTSEKDTKKEGECQVQILFIENPHARPIDNLLKNCRRYKEELRFDKELDEATAEYRILLIKSASTRSRKASPPYELSFFDDEEKRWQAPFLYDVISFVSKRYPDIRWKKAMSEYIGLVLTTLEAKRQELISREQARAEKNKGNEYYKGGKYDQAINCYTNAIKMCPPGDKETLSTFYHNRAAAYEKLKNTKMVIDDCNKALRLNPKYQKALSRRALAYKLSGDLTQALEDLTALCTLEGFQNPQSLMTAHQILKTLGQTKAKEAFKTKKPMIPSRQFIRTYLRSFQNDPVINAAKALQTQQNGHTEDGSPYQGALQKLAAEEYEEIIDCCSKEIAANTNKMFEARLLRGTMYFLSNQQKEALEDLNQVLAAKTLDKRVKVNALIKRGTLYIQQEKHTEGLDDFATAVRIDPDNVDVYHHRGQHNIQLDRMEDAIRDLENAISKSTTFAPSHVQKSFAEHKKATSQMVGMNLPLPQSVLQSYKQCVDMFPDYGEARALYAQALADAGKFEAADREFAKSLELEPDNATVIAHRGLLQLQWKQNIQEATSIINKAIELDPKCEYAYEVLGTLEIQKGPGSMEKAIEFFKKAMSLSKTESEMANLFSLSEAAKAQLNVTKKFGISLPSLSGMNS